MKILVFSIDYINIPSHKTGTLRPKFLVIRSNVLCLCWWNS